MSSRSLQRLTQKSVWYLSHPVAPDSHYTYEQNMAHALHMVKLCYDEGFRVYIPWHSLCLVMPDSNPEFRRIGLEVDCELAKLTGLMILTGHRMSSGMQAEMEALLTRKDAFWIDGIGLHDKRFCDLLRSTRKRILQLMEG